MCGEKIGEIGQIFKNDDIEIQAHTERVIFRKWLGFDVNFERFDEKNANSDEGV